MTAKLDKTKFRYRNLVLHVLGWAVLIVVPLFFHSSDDPWSHVWTRYMRWLGTPLAYMLVFYINYLWVVPRYLIKKKDWKMFLLINVGVIALGLCAIDVWHVVSQNLLTELPDQVRQNPARRPSRVPRYFWAVLILCMFIALTVAVRMYQRWQHVEDVRKEAEAARAEAELSNLRNQLNPHFLLNTLNNIYALIAFDANKAQLAVDELSRLLRHVLYDNQQSFVPLYKEVAFMHNYIELMRIRVTDGVRIETDIRIADDDATPIAPLLFISLLENAFKHGISPQGKGFIRIEMSQEQGTITCAITNSNYPKRANDKSGSGIGLEQVSKRLELIYHDRYTWDRGLNNDNTEYHSKIVVRSATA